MAPAFQFNSVEAARLPDRPLHLAIGMFDGVHLGHRAVIEAAVGAARRDGGVAGVLTFRPHPSVIFRPADPTRLIHQSPAQSRLLADMGVAVVITHPFTAEFARTRAGEFLPWLKRRLPQLAAIYVGENWRFGAGRAGDVALLKAVGSGLGISVFSAPPINFAGEPVASTRIRGLLEAGDVAGANALLGYNYFAEGEVIPGKRLGRTIGFPTLNLAWAPDLRPRFGVYVVQVRGETRGQAVNSISRSTGINDLRPDPLPGVANYGLRPTLEQASVPQLETHLFGNCPFDSGDFITVEWLRFLRPEKKFVSLHELKAQIARDVEAARGV